MCEINQLYEAYKFACNEEDRKEGPLNKNLIIDYVKSLFPGVKKSRRRSNGTQQTVYQGISLMDANDNPSENVKFCDIPLYLTFFKSMQLKNSSEETIQILQDSGCFSNGNTIYKVLNLHANGVMEVSVSGQTVDLTKLNVKCSFNLDVNSVLTTFEIFKSLKLCNGLRFNKSVTVSRFHTLESWKYGEDSFRSIRSLSCLRLAPVNSSSSTCRVCQQQYYQDNKENAENEEESTTAVLKKLFPGAPSQMIAILAEQAKNVGRSPNGRRWSKDVISICLQLYNRSPKCYELLKSSQILILPSQSMLILYKNALRQEPGFDESIFEWMHEEASRVGLTEDERIGGVIFDEMSIQQDIQMEKRAKT